MRYRLPGRPWFRPRSSGFGASPKTWEGWLFIAGYIGGIAAFAHAAGSHHLAFLAATLALTVVFVIFVWLKTDDQWQWHWDGKVGKTMRIDADRRRGKRNGT